MSALSQQCLRLPMLSGLDPAPAPRRLIATLDWPISCFHLLIWPSTDKRSLLGFLPATAIEDYPTSELDWTSTPETCMSSRTSLQPYNLTYM